MFSTAGGHIRANIEAARHDLVQLQIPSQILRHKPGIRAGSSAKIKWLDRRCVNQHVEVVPAVDNGRPVGIVIGECDPQRLPFMCGDPRCNAHIAKAAAALVVKQAESRRGIHLARNPLIFEANSEIEREVGTHQQTILNETDIFAISRIDWLWRAKDNSLRQRPVLPDDIDGAC